MTTKAQSIPKQDGGFISQNEDAIRLNKSLIGLSDGAGGTGVEAHQWAEYLLKNLSKKPITHFAALTEWQDSIWQNYFDRIEHQLENSNSIALEKFYTEGSSATLMAVWVEGKGKNKVAHIMSYGDSVVLLWREKTKECWTNTEDLSSFLQSPFLLNCNEPPLEHGYFQTISIEKGDILILASDTIGQFLLASFYLLEEKEKHSASFQTIRNSPNRFSSYFQTLENYYTDRTTETWHTVLSELKKALKSESSFKSYTEALRSFGQLGIDDYSVVLVGF